MKGGAGYGGLVTPRGMCWWHWVAHAFVCRDNVQGGAQRRYTDGGRYVQGGGVGGRREFASDLGAALLPGMRSDEWHQARRGWGIQAVGVGWSGWSRANADAWKRIPTAQASRTQSLDAGQLLAGTVDALGARVAPGRRR